MLVNYITCARCYAKAKPVVNLCAFRCTRCGWLVAALDILQAIGFL